MACEKIDNYTSTPKPLTVTDSFFYTDTYKLYLYGYVLQHIDEDVGTELIKFKLAEKIKLKNISSSRSIHFIFTFPWTFFWIFLKCEAQN